MILLNYTLSERIKFTILYSTGSLVLPGEVEQTVAGYTPYFDHTIHLKVKVLPVTQPSNNKTQEVCGHFYLSIVSFIFPGGF